MTKKRPFGVTILAILAAIGAIIAIMHTLQMLHLFPISGPFGQFSFFTFDLWGAILWGILALIYIWVVRMLWNLQPQGWLFVVALSALNLILAVVSILGQSTWQAMLPAIIINGLILIYGLLPGTKDAFGVADGVPSADQEKAAPAASSESTLEQDVEPEAAAAAAVAVESTQEQEVVVEDTAVPEDTSTEAEPEVSESTAPEMEAEAEPDVPPAAAMAGAAAAVEITQGQEVEPEETAATEEPSPTAEQQDSEDTAPEMEVEVEAPAAAMVTGAAATSRDLSYVEGIGAVNAGKLKAAGIDTLQTLLERGATPKGRKELAEDTGISSKLILTWINHADLFRIKGLGSEYADLLEEAGVDTVPELAQRNPANLHKKVVEVNEEKHLVRRSPSQSQIEDWVSQAKQLPRVISY